MDYIAIKDFNAEGELIGEHRFYGLMTRAAYNSRALDIPLLADRIQAVMDMAHFPPGSHNAKMLLQILETFPRDELFQSSTKTLFNISMGVLAIEEHNRIRVFSRADPFHRYHSILVYIPREHYSQAVRERIQSVVSTALNAERCDFNIFFTDSRMARLQLIAQMPANSHLRVDSRSLEKLVEGITESWHGKLKKLLLQHYDRRDALAIYRYYADGFSGAYTAKTNTEKAFADIEHLEKLHSSAVPVSVKIYRDISRRENRVELRCYFKTQPLPLSEIQPRLNNLGLRLLLEDLYPVQTANGNSYWVQDFRAEVAVNVNQLFWNDSSHFENAFVAIYQNLCDDDDFNRLIISADISWREAGLLRSYCRYLKQLGSNFEQAYLSKLLVENGSIARLLIDMFHARFTPGMKNADQRFSKLEEQLEIALEGVKSLDADRLFGRHQPQRYRGRDLRPRGQRLGDPGDHHRRERLRDPRPRLCVAARARDLDLGRRPQSGRWMRHDGCGDRPLPGPQRVQHHRRHGQPGARGAGLTCGAGGRSGRSGGAAQCRRGAHAFAQGGSLFR